jgi:Tol biopolymer transport system component
MSWGTRGGVAVVVALAVGTVGCTPTQPWRSELVSVNRVGDNAGNHRSTGAVISADGTKVVFESQASDLVPNDTNGGSDVFVRDLRTGQTRLVSFDTTGSASGNNSSLNPVISADGTKIAFESHATNLTSTVEPNGALVDVYVRDLSTGITSLAATSTDGFPTGTAGSITPRFSPDGTRLAFVGSGLHPLDTTLGLLGPDIYVRDLTTGVVDLVTVNATNDGSGNDWSLDPGDFSPDGSQLAFTSPASNLVPGDTNQVADLFVRDLAAHTTTLVSVNAAGTGAGNAGTEYGASFSPDGHLLAFTSRASDLVATDTNEASDVFARDLTAGTTSLVSINAAGTDSGRGTITGFNESSGPIFSPDGHSVAFTSYASDFGPTDTDTDGDLFIDTDIYVRDLIAGSTSLVSSNADGTDSDRGRSERPIFTGDGGKILFEGDGNPLGGQPTTAEWGQLYMKDLVTGNVTLVSATADGTAGSNGWSGNASMSADGLSVAFESGASNLGPADTNSRADIYLAHLQGADLATTLTPVSTGGPGGTTTLQVTLDNRGPDDGPVARAAVLLPPGLSFINAEAEVGSCAPPSAEQPGLVVCDLGHLPVGETASATVVAAVTGAGGQVLALGSSEAIDPDPTNNTASRALGN